MEQTDRFKLISLIAEEILCRGNECTLTHIQKTCYFMQKMLEVEMDYEFTGHRFGPFCQALADDVDEARMNSVLIHSGGLRPNTVIRKYLDKYKQSDELSYADEFPYADELDFVANWFKFKNASQAGLVAAIYMEYFDKPGNKGKSSKERLEIIKKWKPQFHEVVIKKAIKEVKAKQKEAEKFLASKTH